MTPEERSQSELDLIKQYSNEVQCLGILYHKIRAGLRNTAVAFREVEQAEQDTGFNPHISTATLDAADALRGLVVDYRETHDRCTQLKAALSGFPVIVAVPHKRF